MWLECFWGTIVLTRVVKTPSQIPPAQNKPVFPFFSPSHMICHLSAVLGNFYCTVLTMETLNRAGSSRPKAESNPLEILFCFFFFWWEVAYKQIWNQFSQPYLPDGDHIKILLPFKNTTRTMTNLYCRELQPSSASSLCASPVYYLSKKLISLVWSGLFSTHHCSFFSQSLYYL